VLPLRGNVQDYRPLLQHPLLMPDVPRRAELAQNGPIQCAPDAVPILQQDRPTRLRLHFLRQDGCAVRLL
jgi:hypothetical protein